MSIEDNILVYTGNASTRRTIATKKLKIDDLVSSVNQFLNKINTILENVPDQYDKFRFEEISFSAEISANGKLVLLGTGIEAATKGALVFKFKRIEP